MIHSVVELEVASSAKLSLPSIVRLPSAGGLDVEDHCLASWRW